MKLIDRLFYSPNLNILATIYFNFKVLPFKQAIKLPVFLYGKWVFKTLKGNLILADGNINTGSNRMGLDSAGGFFAPARSSMAIHKNGMFILHSKVRVAQGTSITIFNGATLEAKDGCVITDNVKIICTDNITIGENTRLGWETQVIDSNFHYTYSGAKRIVRRRSAPVFLGDNCWFGNRCSVMPGTVTENGCVFASGSLANKDYVAQGVKPHSFLAGTPAKLVAEDIYRVWDEEVESKLNDYFDKSEKESVLLDEVL